MIYSIDTIKNNQVRGFVTSLLASVVVIFASIIAFFAVILTGSASAAYGESTSLVPVIQSSLVSGKTVTAEALLITSKSHLSGVISLPTEAASMGPIIASTSPVNGPIVATSSPISGAIK